MDSIIVRCSPIFTQLVTLAHSEHSAATSLARSITSSLSSRYLVVSLLDLRVRTPRRSTPLHIRRMIFLGFGDSDGGSGVCVDCRLGVFEGWSGELVVGPVDVVVDVDWVSGITEG